MNTTTSGRCLRPVTLRRYWPALAIAVIVAVTAGVFVWGGRDAHARARVGQAFESRFSRDEKVETSSATLRLPTGEIGIETTAPQQSVPAGLNTDDRFAPDGGSFVGVDVTTDAEKALPLPAVADGIIPKITVALVVGSRRYDVPARFRSQALGNAVDRSVWVAVAGSPRAVRVAVTYDGVTQTVDMQTGKRTTGAAAPLYRLASVFAPRPEKSCGAPSVSNGFRVAPDRVFRCEVRTVGALPYLPGRGWAPAGTTWFTVLVGIRDDARFVRGGQEFRTVNGGSGPVIAAATTGRPATLRMVTPTAYVGLSASARLAAFTAPIGSTPTFTLTATYRDLEAIIDSPTRTVAEGPTATATWTVTP